MKKIFTAIIASLLFLSSCVNLDLDPLSEASSENWYKSETQLQMSVNNLYWIYFWQSDGDDWTDDWMYRDFMTPVTNGTINSEWDYSEYLWTYCYKAIARANTIIEKLPDAQANGVSAAFCAQVEAECKFVRAYQYAYLISHFGDVPDVRGNMTIDQALKMGRTAKAELIPKVYADFDDAAAVLPVSYAASEVKHATKGAALALKSRFALYMQDWAVAETAAKACLDLNAYTLASNYRNYFLPSTKNNAESIFLIPRSIELGVYFSDCQNYITRNVGGYAAKDPSWDLFCSYLCTDGLPIDESPLFNPKLPFANRDPRCAANIVEFGTEWLGYYKYNPAPNATTVWNSYYQAYRSNKDTRAVAQYASYNGLVWKKGIDNTWYANSYRVAPDYVIIRLAEVMLIYAEACIEQNKIDQTVLDAMNKVRARAYGVAYTATASYPAITTTSQTELRKLLRIERRMEFPLEGLRYMDIIRWKLAEKVLNRPN